MKTEFIIATILEKSAEEREAYLTLLLSEEKTLSTQAEKFKKDCARVNPPNPFMRLFPFLKARKEDNKGNRRLFEISVR